MIKWNLIDILEGHKIDFKMQNNAMYFEVPLKLCKNLTSYTSFCSNTKNKDLFSILHFFKKKIETVSRDSSRKYVFKIRDEGKKKKN